MTVNWIFILKSCNRCTINRTRYSYLLENCLKGNCHNEFPCWNCGCCCPVEKCNKNAWWECRPFTVRNPSSNDNRLQWLCNAMRLSATYQAPNPKSPTHTALPLTMLSLGAVQCSADCIGEVTNFWMQLPCQGECRPDSWTVMDAMQCATAAAQQ